MKAQKDAPFSWPLLFIVTAASFFLFGIVTKYLDGPIVHVSLFYKIGIVAAGLGLISFTTRLFSNAEE